MSDAPPTKEEMLKCLERSGYCLEGRLVKALDALGFFVETNQAHFDERSGKSREIDLVAESYRHVEGGHRTCVKTNLVSAEWMNNATDEYWRIFNWQPVVVVQNDLYVLTENKSGKYELEATAEAKLQLNFHHKGEPKSTMVTFVTEAHLPTFARQVLARDAAVEDQMVKVRLNLSSAPPPA